MKKIDDKTRKIQPLDGEAMKRTKERLDILTKPKESLGILEDLALRVAGITGEITPKIDRKMIITMAGDHGVVEDGVSAYPQEVTPQMVYNPTLRL
ncbi:MAG: nicotinate-nucleotide--dimethylbenzimidazole phosphoribosyltransferase [Halobacteriota archaeon]|nr:nicotinate-nucleotide--dimethylbenzimidazole phosphoribosyltransferase [Halobacteriota archaeon]